MLTRASYPCRLRLFAAAAALTLMMVAGCVTKSTKEPNDRSDYRQKVQAESETYRSTVK